MRCLKLIRRQRNNIPTPPICLSSNGAMICSIIVSGHNTSSSAKIITILLANQVNIRGVLVLLTPAVIWFLLLPFLIVITLTLRPSGSEARARVSSASFADGIVTKMISNGSPVFYN